MRAVPYGDAGYFKAYCRAWHMGGDTLRSFFAAGGEFCDIAAGVQLKADELDDFVLAWGAFSPDSRIRFGTHVAGTTHFSVEWNWAGTATGSITLDGTTFTGTGGRFDIDGVSFCALDDAGAILSHTDYYDPRPLLDQCDISRDA
jgi:hypothetical protein